MRSHLTHDSMGRNPGFKTFRRNRFQRFESDMSRARVRKGPIRRRAPPLRIDLTKSYRERSDEFANPSYRREEE